MGGPGPLGTSQRRAPAYEAALALLSIDPAVLPQQRQRLDDGRPGNLELSDQLMLRRQQGPRLVLPPLDPPLDLGDYLRVLRRRVVVSHGFPSGPVHDLSSQPSWLTTICHVPPARH